MLENVASPVSAVPDQAAQDHTVYWHENEHQLKDGIVVELFSSPHHANRARERPEYLNACCILMAEALIHQLSARSS